MELQRQAADTLPQNSMLRRRYRVVRTIGRGEYGATYEAFDVETRRSVALKEYFPARLSRRAEDSLTITPLNRECGTQFFLGSEAFLAQHSALVQAAGSRNVVTVYDAFFENGTSYAVMEKLTGMTLGACMALSRRRIGEGQAVFILQSLSEALLVVHSLSMLHGSIAPENVFVCADGTLKLIDFGAARETLRQPRKAADVPHMQSDIRALGGMVYTLMTGKNAPSEPAPLYAQMQPALADVLSRMLTNDAQSRFESVFDLMHTLNCIEIAPEPIRIPSRTQERPERERGEAGDGDARRKAGEVAARNMSGKRTRLLLIVGGVLLTLLIILIAVLAARG